MKFSIIACALIAGLSLPALAETKHPKRVKTLNEAATAGYQVPGCVDYYISTDRHNEGKVVQICDPRRPFGQPAKQFWDTVLSVGGGSD